jgi:hypothetical protein
VLFVLGFMIWKLVTLMVMVLLVLVSVSLVYENMPIDPIILKTNYLEPENLSLIEYGAVPVFAENLRFNHNDISYFISDDCDQDRRDSMVEAFVLLSDKVSVLSFYEAMNKDVTDINVECSYEYVELSDSLFAAGEGGPSRIINTSVFRTIEKGRILLYNDESCTYPIVEMHELLHVFGFDHSNDPRNIMYNVSDCSQRISDDVINLMTELYSVEALPDAKISELSAIKRGRYLDFNISVLNEGLIGIDEIKLTVFADDDIVGVLDLGEIDIGYGRILRAGNMRLPRRDVGVIRFVVDFDDDVRELDEDNNVVEMMPEAQ